MAKSLKISAERSSLLPSHAPPVTLHPTKDCSKQKQLGCWDRQSYISRLDYIAVSPTSHCLCLLNYQLCLAELDLEGLRILIQACVHSLDPALDYLQEKAWSSQEKLQDGVQIRREHLSLKQHLEDLWFLKSWSLLDAQTIGCKLEKCTSSLTAT